MKIAVGVMGSAEVDSVSTSHLSDKAELLGRAIADTDVIMLSGATTGLVYLVGKTAHDGGTYHVGVSPAENVQEHVERYRLPIDACDVLIYTGFGLKGRNVVLVRSCEVVLFIAGAMGSLNEFTIAHDEGKIIGCLAQTGGVADQADYLVEKFSKRSNAQVFRDEDPARLLTSCLATVNRRQAKG
jgi:uncharacterized protein (TIGR00725 family)